jgi:hypothetical protein
VFETSGRHITVNLNGQQTRIGSFAVGIEPRGFAGQERASQILSWA